MHQLVSYFYSLCKIYQVSKVLLVDDSKLSREPNADAKAVDIIRINMYLLHKILGCWF